VRGLPLSHLQNPVCRTRQYSLIGRKIVRTRKRPLVKTMLDELRVPAPAWR